jgi:type IV secretion system protein VirD4
MALGLTVATQIFALQARQDPALGFPLSRHGWLILYPPWGIIVWAWQWGSLTGWGPWKLATLGGLGSAALVLSQVRIRPPRKSRQAHWATSRELRQAQCRGKEGSGVVLGKRGRRILRYTGPGHTLVIGQVRSGKTAGFAIPNLLEWPGTIIAYDPKSELRALTEGYRTTMSRVLNLAPLDPHTDGYNLLQAVRLKTDDEIRDVDLIAGTLTNPDGKKNREDATEHFQELVNQFFRGVMLYGLYSGLAMTCPALNDLITRTRWGDLVTVLQHQDHPEMQRAGEVTSRIVDRELGSLQTTAARALSLFSDPRIAGMTSRNDVPLTALREEDTPCTVYLSAPFTDLARLRPLVRIMVTQMLGHCTTRLTGWRHKVLVLIDEMPSLGHMTLLSDGLNYLAGYGVQLALMSPSMEELIHLYGPHHNFLEACRVQAIFGLSDERVAERVSKRIGNHERTIRRITRQHGGRGGLSISEDTRQEPLISPTGVLQLPEQSVLLSIGRHSLVADQARYYQHPLWRRRSQLPLPERTPACFL